MSDLTTSSMVLGSSADDAATIQKTVFSLLDTIRQAEVKRVLTNTAKAQPADDSGSAEDTDESTARASFETVNDVMCGQALTMLRQNIWKNHIVPSDCGFTSVRVIAVSCPLLHAAIVLAHGSGPARLDAINPQFDAWK